jgi:ABC-type glycerol-3-phosphate transport system substrate-binding protein
VDNPFQGFHDKALTLFQAQKLADVLMVQVDWVAEFADVGMLEPLDNWLAKEPKEFLGNISEAFQQKWKGKQYYLPLHSGCVALYWNTEIFKNAGIAGPPKTWDEYVEIAKKVTNPREDLCHDGHAADQAADQHDRHLPADPAGGRGILDTRTTRPPSTRQRASRPSNGTWI